MQLVKVAAAALNQTPLAWEGNLRNALAAIADARAQGVSLLCLPELSLTGYGCEDAFHSRGVQREALEALRKLLPHTQGMVVSVGVPVLHRNGLYDTAALIVDARVVGFAAKRHLAGDGLHYEPRWFKPWPDGVRAEVDFFGARVPIGDLLFDVGGVGIGFEICEDAWVAKRPGAALSLQGVDVILNPSASHFAFDKQEIRKRFVLEGSRAFGVTYVYSNLLGNEAGRVLFDGGTLIATGGKLVAQGPRFSFRQSLICTAVVDIDATRMGQSRTASFTPEVSDTWGGRVEAPFAWPEQLPEKTAHAVAAWENSEHVKEEEFLRAEAMGLFDYLRKSRSDGFVVSLSGGADSAACALLVSLMTELAAAELGLPEVLKMLGYARGAQAAQTPREFAHALLLCVYQATRNSGGVTRSAAAAIAEAAGAQFLVLDVEPLVAGYTKLIEQAIGRELSWKSDDMPLQNIQARTRSPSVWLLANLRNALLLSTSNRSEAAVGYATMDGDTSGGLSPIAGIDKNFLRQFLRWLESSGPSGLHPVPALQAVNAQQPTAELRPMGSGQTDEEDLMPYDLLDAVERAAIRDKLLPAEVFQRMRSDFPAYAPRVLGLYVERFFRLWCRNQWKRERYAPSFHLDDENLDPKTWCRFPILSSGFDKELRDLRALIEELPS